MRVSRPILGSLLALALTAVPAHAAAPVPGAHYEGTTENGSPFSFDVAPDGATLTNVITTLPVTCIGGNGGVEISAVASKFAFPIAGGAISGEDANGSPRTTLTGTFTSAQEAAGSIVASYGTFSVISGLTTCRGERNWTARTTAAAPTTSTPAPTTTTTTGTTPAPATTPAVAPISLTAPRGAKLPGALRKGFTVAGRAEGAARVTAALVLAKADARRYGLGRRAVTIARATATTKAAGPFSLRFKPSARTARALRAARRLALTLQLVTSGAGGARQTRTERIALKR